MKDYHSNRSELMNQKYNKSYDSTFPIAIKLADNDTGKVEFALHPNEILSIPAPKPKPLEIKNTIAPKVEIVKIAPKKVIIEDENEIDNEIDMEAELPVDLFDNISEDYQENEIDSENDFKIINTKKLTKKRKSKDTTVEKIAEKTKKNVNKRQKTHESLPFKKSDKFQQLTVKEQLQQLIK